MSGAAIRALVWAATVIAVCAVAAWRGRRDEQLAAGVMLAAWALSMLLDRAKFQDIEWGILAVDIAALCGFIWIALLSRRYWPMFAAGFHLLAVVTHVARLADPAVGGWAYITGEIIWGYLLAIAIGYGALSAPRAYPAIAADPNNEPGATRR
jgi:hypothetical protein